MKNFFQENITLTYRSIGLFTVILAVLALTYSFALAEQKKALQAKIYVPPIIQATPAPTEIPPHVTIIPATKGEQVQTSFKSTMHPDTDLDFKPYSITYPSSWQLESSKEIHGSDLTISKNGYTLSIKQHGTDGMNCIFEGELPKTAYVADLRKAAYTEISTNIGTFRRFKSNSNTGSPDMLIIEFCQEIVGNYRNPELGSISYAVPPKYEESILLEMDKMLQTIQLSN